jgi:hypothetical protein
MEPVMLDWLGHIFGLAPQGQLVEIETREPSLEERLERILKRAGPHRHRSLEEIEELIADLNKILDILDKIINTLENISGAERAKNLRKRLRIKRAHAEAACLKMRAAAL